MLTIQKNGRVACPQTGLTSGQYAAVQAQPRQCYSEPSRQFTFWPTPLGCHRLRDAGFQLEGMLHDLAGKWQRFDLFTKSLSGGSPLWYGDVLKTVPWKHQPGAIEFGMNCPSPYFNMGMGTGKSLCTLGTIGKNAHHKTLVLCPNAVVGVWPREVRLHTHEGQYQVLALDDTFKSVAKKLEAADRFLKTTHSPLIVAVNYESGRTEKFSDWATSRKWDCVVCDEAHRIKSPSGPTTRFASNLDCGQPIALSGTMQPHDPLDLWGQFRFLEPALLESSFIAFKKRYAIEGKFNEVVRWVNLEDLHQRIKPLVYRVDSEVLDLPPSTHQQFRFHLSHKVSKLYRELRKELFARIGAGVVTADNVLVRGLRLQQLTSGFFYDEVTEQEIALDEQPKIDALLDWQDAIEQGDRFVVFTRFKRDVETVCRALQKARPELRIGRLTGSQNDLTRDATFDPRFDCYVVNIASGGVGVDLTLANHALYYSVSWNASDYEQSLARLRRPGQTKSCHFAHCIAADTIDEEIYEAFQECRDLAAIVIDGIMKGGSR